MEKELHEHPVVIGDTLRGMIDPTARAVALPALPFDFATLPRITISACGSAFYAGLVGRWWFETIAGIQTDADVASEFRYRTPPMAPEGLGLLVSQSGETADTMAALHYMREQRQHVLSIVNVPGEQHGTRIGRCAGNGGWPGGERGQHQGVHRATIGAGLPGPCRRPRARHDLRIGEGHDDGVAAGSATTAHRRCWIAATRSRRWPIAYRRLATCCTSAAATVSRLRWKAR